MYIVYNLETRQKLKSCSRTAWSY